MKNATYSYTYTLTLQIRHPSRDLFPVINELSKIPHATIGKGVMRPVAGGTETVYDKTRIHFDYSDFDGWRSALLNEDMPEAIEKMVDALYPHKALLQKLFEDGCTLSLRVGWAITSNIGAGFSTELLRKLSELRISLDFFSYVDDPQQNRQNEQSDRVAEQIRTILYKYDPSGVVDKTVPLPELHFDQYQDLFYLLPHFIKARASKKQLEEELRDELCYFNRTNTDKLKTFQDYETLAAELSELQWE